MILEPKRHRSLPLVAVSLLSVVMLCLLPGNRAWVRDVVDDYAQVPLQLRTRGYEERMRARHYRNFAVLEYIEHSLRPSDVFLLPPLDYVRRHFDPVYWNWAEPKYFYYMLGRRSTVTLDDPRVGQATGTVVIDNNGRPSFVRITGPRDLERLRATFRE